MSHSSSIRVASRTAASVVPVLGDPAPGLSSSPSWPFELQPTHQLPVLDLSKTLKSQLLTPAGQRRFNRVTRFPQVYSIGYLITSVLHVAALVAPARIGQVLAVIGFVTGMPGTILTLSTLRYDVLKVLVPTFDIVFFNSIVVSTLALLMATVHDARVFLIIQAILATQINSFVDANIQGVRRVALINSFGTVSTAFVACVATLGVIPDMKNFVIFRYGSRRVESRDFIANGMATIMALMLRNIYRKRAVLFNKSKGEVFDCVSYRCSLAFHSPIASSGQSTKWAAIPATRKPVEPSKMQPMRYVSSLPRMDASRVVVPVAFTWLVQPQQSSRRRVVRLVMSSLGWTAVILVIVVGVAKFAYSVRDGWTATPRQLPETVAKIVDTALLVSLLLSCIYTTICTALLQRDLVAALFSSFDFVFLSSQLTFIHLAVADFFRWHRACLPLALTWLWSHWIFCIDNLTPIVRERIGFTMGFVKLVIVALVVSSAILNHLLIFSDGSADIYDRVLWSGHFFGQDVEIRLMSSFYSSYVTVIAWALRLLWRIFRAPHHGLVMIDGPVAYTNLRPPPPAQATTMSRLRMLSSMASHRIGRRLAFSVETRRPTEAAAVPVPQDATVRSPNGYSTTRA